MEKSAGKIAGFGGLERTAPAAAPGPLGPNELEGVAMLYKSVSDDREAYLPGAFADFSGHKIIFGYEHRLPLGVAQLTEHADRVTFRARLAGDKLVCSALWRLWQAGFFRDLCLSSVSLQTSTGRAIDGGPVNLIHKGQPRELSAVLAPGILGCKITGLGRLLEKQTTWDYNLWRGNFVELAQYNMAFFWASWCDRRVNRNENQTEESYNEWLANIEI
jgi:hypothetical protein